MRAKKLLDTNKAVALTFLATATVAASSLVAAAPAQARVQSCQPSSVQAVLRYKDGTKSTFSCTGTYSPFNKDAGSFSSVAWSGYSTYRSGERDVFCNDSTVWYPNGIRVTKVELSPTRVC